MTEQKKRGLGDYVEFVAMFFWGFVVITFSDTTMMALALAAVALGFLTNALIAVSAYLFLFTVLRTINSVANAIGVSGQNLAESLHGIGRLIALLLPQPEHTTEENDSAS